MTVSEAIEALKEIQSSGGGDSEIRVAYQRSHPLEAGLETIAAPGTFCEECESCAAGSGFCDEAPGESGVVYFGTGEGSGYLSSAGSAALEW